MSVYAIGDVQGCYNSLKQLLKKIHFSSDRDQLWFVGDIVNRGPDSLKTLRFIKDLGEQAVTVLGNHDLHLLAIAHGYSKSGKKDTLTPILKAKDSDKLLDWLANRPLIHYQAELQAILVHAGIHPSWTVPQALALGDELHQVLSGDKRKAFFAQMYGNKPELWSETLEGWDRLRYITNVFTRMRYLDIENLSINLKEKGTPDYSSKTIQPWFTFAQPLLAQYRIIFGHWSTLTDPGISNLYPIDTGCLWGGKMTAIKLDAKNVQPYQIKCPQAQPIS